MMRPVLAFLCVLLLPALPARAQTAEAEHFVAQGIEEAFFILRNTDLSTDGRAAQLERHLLRLTDMRRVALFTLGPAAQTATPAQRDAFVAAFRDYALATWRAQFMTFLGGSMTVTGARANAADDILVHASLTDGSGRAVMPVDFRVRTGGAGPVIVDIGLAGIWLAVVQRDDFAAFLARNQGDVAALTANLEARVKALR